MEAFIIIIAIYFTVYLCLILGLAYGFTKVKAWKRSVQLPKIGFSIIVPFRNEMHNLPLLLESIKNLNYPKELFEIILVDDFSTDNGQSEVYKWRMANGEFHTTLLENIRISGSPKKDAISRAIPIVAHEWIITTDADCILPIDWLSALNGFILSANYEMVAAPVVCRGKLSFLGHFQLMDLLSLQAVTVGSFGLGNPFMCNGANFAYTKKIFHELNGFDGNTSQAGGDDVFLLQKAAMKHPDKIGYLKSTEAIVVTQRAKSWSELFHQHVRWASKAASYQSDYGEILALVTLFGNASVFAFLALAFGDWISWEAFAVVAVLKLLTDAILILQANSFLRKGKFVFPVFSSLFYPFFSLAVGIYALFGKYEWKGRKFR